ncbi:MAG TPA: complex I subunit 1 family protein [Chloroflexia bacterium]
MEFDWVWVVIRFLVSCVVLTYALIGAGFWTLILRKVGARMQQRLGPNRVGPGGMFQWAADLLKMLLKEPILPAAADKPVFLAAPIVAVFAATAAYAFIPFGEQITVFGRPIPYYVAETPVGLLALLALSSLQVYGLLMAAWSSNSKYPMLSGLRAGAQVISYEIIMGLALVGVMLLAQSLNLNDISRAQGGSLVGGGAGADTPGIWLLLLQPVGLLIYLLAGLAEVTYPPFDVVEAETELIAGYHVEYSGIQFGLFQAAEFVGTMTVGAITTTCFLGGWQPILPLGGAALAPFWFLLKTSAIVFVLMWVRWTLPRFRYDQLMGICWKVMLPLALANLLLVATLRLLVPAGTPPLGHGSFAQALPWLLFSAFELIFAVLVVLALSRQAARSWSGKSEHLRAAGPPAAATARLPEPVAPPRRVELRPGLLTGMGTPDRSPGEGD